MEIFSGSVQRMPDLTMYNRCRWISIQVRGVKFWIENRWPPILEEVLHHVLSMVLSMAAFMVFLILVLFLSLVGSRLSVNLKPLP